MIGGWVTGVDVSRAQRPSACDWHRAHAAGVSFAFVKLTEGKDYLDSSAREHVYNIRDAGILAGVYHVGRPDNRFRDTRDGTKAGKLEAEWLLEQLDAVPRDFRRPVLDLEKYTARDVSAEQRGDYVRALVGAVKRDLNVAPIIYTGDDYWRYQMPASLAAELRAEGCLLWLVDYTDEAEPRSREVIAGWPWSFWQCSGGKQFAFAAPIDGLPCPIDVNRYRGSLDELRGLAGGAA